MTEANFSHETVDDMGQTAPLHLIGTLHQHLGNKHVYKVIGVAWMGAEDEWGLVHTRQGNEVTCVRSYTNFFGNRSNGEPRFHPLATRS